MFFFFAKMDRKYIALGLIVKQKGVLKTKKMTFRNGKVFNFDILNDGKVNI